MIGIAIPSHRGDACHILPLLENISQSTLLPTQISISCSSWDSEMDISFDYKGIPVILSYTTRTLNAAANRNRAARRLTTDLISFFDVDDRMHPSRLAYVVEGLKSYDAIYHLYQAVGFHGAPFSDAGELRIREGLATRNDIWGIALEDYLLHHAHVSVRRSLFDRMQFDERPEHYRREDSIYGRDLYNAGVKMALLTNTLSHYLVRE